MDITTDLTELKRVTELRIITCQQLDNTDEMDTYL